MKAVAVYALHYGCEYLPWSVRSVQDAVDEIIVCYTEQPSYGFKSSERCPESEGDLSEAAHRFLHKPMMWHKGEWYNEGHHRQATLTLAKRAGADLVLVVDADELWDTAAAVETLRYVYDQHRAGRWLANFQNFWRSVRWEIRDCFKPIRVVDLRHPIDVDAYLGEAQPVPVYHYGYAQSLPIMRYKWTCHGHQAELRSGWFDQKFIPWTPQKNDELSDLHPTVNNLWDKAYRVTPEVDAITNRLLEGHPNLQKELVE